MTAPDTRERNARVLGVAAAAAAMTASWFAIGWPAPAVSCAFGLIVYGLARGQGPAERDDA